MLYQKLGIRFQNKQYLLIAKNRTLKEWLDDYQLSQLHILYTTLYLPFKLAYYTLNVQHCICLLDLSFRLFAKTKGMNWHNEVSQILTKNAYKVSL
jgi:hypothetical protein